MLIATFSGKKIIRKTAKNLILGIVNVKIKRKWTRMRCHGYNQQSSDTVGDVTDVRKLLIAGLSIYRLLNVWTIQA